MRWNEIITEGRDAPLYHATSVLGAINILHSDRINATTQHPDHGIGDEVGVSLTRLRSVTKHFGDVVFVIDQAKLRQTRRLRPVDYWGLNNEPELAGVGRRRGHYAEAEEFLAGDLEPLHRYLLAIDIPRKVFFALYERAKESPDFYRVLLDHPLLKVDGKSKPDPAINSPSFG